MGSKCNPGCTCKRHFKAKVPCSRDCVCGRHNRKPLPINTYSGIHARLNRQRGPASDHYCQCGHKAKEWAYTHDDPCPDERENADGTKFSLNIFRYKPMCRRCHRRYDKAHISKCPQGHDYTEENTLIDAGKRKCKKCVYKRNTERRKANPLTPEQRRRKTELQRKRRQLLKEI